MCVGQSPLCMFVCVCVCVCVCGSRVCVKEEGGRKIRTIVFKTVFVCWYTSGGIFVILFI